VNIKPMLVRLQNVLDDRPGLMEQMVLLPEPKSAVDREATVSQSINLVVGFNGSLRSQAALDLTMRIAHQTRLATQKQVTVQVVYVVDEHQKSNSAGLTNVFNLGRTLTHLSVSDSELSTSTMSKFPDASVVAQPHRQATAIAALAKPASKKQRAKAARQQSHWFEQADWILWQARCLAEEWRSSFKAHLRFGNIADELRDVAESEGATLLFLGCETASHPIVQNLGSNFPCSVLGIPSALA
jgi:nucleotide-binding universal stress UspA family protein